MTRKEMAELEVLKWIKDYAPTHIGVGTPAYKALVSSVTALLDAEHDDLFGKLVRAEMELQLCRNRLRVINGAVTDQTIEYDWDGKKTTYSAYLNKFRKAKGLKTVL